MSGTLTIQPGTRQRANPPMGAQTTLGRMILGARTGRAATLGAASLAWCAVLVSMSTTPSGVVLGFVLAAPVLVVVATATRKARESERRTRALASEQAALRRLANLATTESCPEQILGALTREIGELLGLDITALLRYERDGTATVRGVWSRFGPTPPVGSRWAVMASAVASEVHRTGGADRIEDPAKISGRFEVWMRQIGARACVGSPVVVHGSPWGVVLGASVAVKRIAPATELRLGEFTELAATAVADADSRRELAASRARVVTSSNLARQRIERDLHDGVQQRLVSLALEARRAEGLAEPDQIDLREHLSWLRVGLLGAVDNLREVANGIHPSILSAGGLRPALSALTRRSPIPVELSVRGLTRAPEQVEVCGYYVVSEALTNALKHSRASTVTIELELDDFMAHLVVRDDGVGGADVRSGSGLLGLIDRVHALGGAIEVYSPAHHGTRLEVHLPWAPSRTSTDGRVPTRTTPDPELSHGVPPRGGARPVQVAEGHRSMPGKGLFPSCCTSTEEVVSWAVRARTTA
jgi:signal transduction histidine kinase